MSGRGDAGLNNAVVRFYCLLTGIVLLAACATNSDHVRSPRVILDSLEPAAQTGQVMMHVNLKNRNNAVMPVSALRYRLELDDMEFAWGISRQSVQVPAHGEAVFAILVPGRMPVTDTGQTQLHYSLSGIIYLADGGGEVSFTEDGVLNRQGAEGP